MGYTLAWNNGSCHLKTAVLLLLLQFFFVFFMALFDLPSDTKTLTPLFGTTSTQTAHYYIMILTEASYL